MDMVLSDRDLQTNAEGSSYQEPGKALGPNCKGEFGFVLVRQCIHEDGRLGVEKVEPDMNQIWVSWTNQNEKIVVAF
jgi:hypothetical protein